MTSVAVRSTPAVSDRRTEPKSVSAAHETGVHETDIDVAEVEPYDEAVLPRRTNPIPPPAPGNRGSTTWNWQLNRVKRSGLDAKT